MGGVLNRAVAAGDVAKAKAALDRGASANGTKKDKKRPIHLAVEKGSLPIIDLLCARGANLDVGDPSNSGRTPLHIAVRKGSLNIVKLLLENRASPDVTDNKGDTPLHSAIRKSKINHIGLLLIYGANVHIRDALNDLPLHIAVKKNNRVIVQMLLNAGASVHVVDASGDMLMHVAARTASSRILEMLREKGCNMNNPSNGSSPLHLAAESGNLEAVQWLLHNGAKLEDLDAKRRTPIGRAIMAKQKHVVQWLDYHAGLRARGTKPLANKKMPSGMEVTAKKKRVTQNVNEQKGSEEIGCVNESLASGDFNSLVELTEKKVDVDTLIFERNDQGMRAVHYTAQTRHIEMLKRLKDKNFDLKALTRKGFTALHCAVLTGQLDAVQWLVSEAGLDVASPSKGGETALDLARTLKRTEMENFLRKACVGKALASGDFESLMELLKEGVEVDSLIYESNDQGMHAVHYAAQRGDIQMMKELKQRNFDLKALTHKGFTALHCAVVNGHLDAAQWLVSEAGLDVASISKEGDTALDLAKMLNKTEIVNYLRKACVEKALASGDFENMIGLLKEGVEVDSLIYKNNDQGMRAVHYAAQRGDMDMLKELKEKNFDLKALTHDDSTALHRAVLTNHLDAVQWLVSEAGLDVASLSSSGETALDLAKALNRTEIADYLNGVSFINNDTYPKAILGLTSDKSRGSRRENWLACYPSKKEQSRRIDRRFQPHGWYFTGDAKACVGKALASGDFESLIELMKEGVEVDSLIFESNDQGMCTVHYAAQRGDTEMLKELKQRNFDLKALTHKGFTALHCAVVNGHLDAAQWLVSEAGLDIASVNKEGETALDLAKMLNKTEIANYLRKACVGKALASGDFESLMELLKEGVEVDSLIYESNDQGMRAVHYAGQRGDIQMLKELKEMNFDLKALTHKGFTALHCAVVNGHLDAAQWLVSEAGLDVASISKEGDTALDLAKMLNKTEIANYLRKACVGKALASGDFESLTELLKEGVEVDSLIYKNNDQGMRAVHYAAQRGDMDMLKELKEKNFDLKALTHDDSTALHRAVLTNHLDAVQWLVSEAGLDVTSVSKEGETALDLAISLNRTEIANYLNGLGKREERAGCQEVGCQFIHARRIREGGSLEDLNPMKQAKQAAQAGDIKKIRRYLQRGFGVNSTFQENNDKGCRLLHFAAEKGHTDLVSFLIENRASVNAASGKGMTPLHLASWGGHTEVIKALLSKGASGNAKTTAGMTAIHLASMGGHVASLEELASSCWPRFLQPRRKSALIWRPSTETWTPSAGWFCGDSTCLCEIIRAGLVFGMHEG
ncbi:serine/threonine-protein phosphatase 6 regulatory ankyrin repeat subunit B-like [Penaeus japonicus]|uniref:serine/threonine-protein phosphatase 6 regulatory ankyrin repeat subunit B-like n=1 Tax=Penaeus japonicus TaxID=27405 RepID=UPI001C714380|nr:serine/threonine-protein phosphatase 6 regulatory ankyrin repeat subunit B-like [Penaeus japonicus]